MTPGENLTRADRRKGGEAAPPAHDLTTEECRKGGEATTGFTAENATEYAADAWHGNRDKILQEYGLYAEYGHIPPKEAGGELKVGLLRRELREAAENHARIEGAL